GGALVADQQDHLGVQRVDPDRVVVVAAGRAFEAGPGRTGVGAAVRAGIGDQHGVPVARMDLHLGEVAAAAPQPWLLGDARPRVTGVVGTEAAAELRRVDHCVDALAVARRDREADAAEPLDDGRQARGQLRPRAAAVARAEQAAARALPAAVLPRPLARLP